MMYATIIITSRNSSYSFLCINQKKYHRSNNMMYATIIIFLKCCLSCVAISDQKQHKESL